MRSEASVSGAAPYALPRKLAGKVDQRPKKIRIVIADLSLQHGGQALEARAGVDGGLGQRRHVSRGVAIELHENQIPDLHVAPAVAAELAIRVARARKPRAHVVVNFAARAARAGVAHGPEIFLQAGNGNHALLRRAHAHPMLDRFVVDAAAFSPGVISAPPKTVK